MSKPIELKYYKVLLLQMANRIIQKVANTGLKPNSKRDQLASGIGELCYLLDRELKRDCTLAQTATAKKDLYDDMFTGEIPDWMLDVIFKSITEESKKLNRRSA
jgi:hypothetical protein